MKRGLVLGKFIPLHSGHVTLIEFAAKKCDELIVLICASTSETISGDVRMGWISESFKTSNIIPILFSYDESILPNTSESSIEVSQIWAEAIAPITPTIDIIFSSEKYGDYLAEIMNCEHISFDVPRLQTKISATEIRNDPFKNWEYIPHAVRPYFIKKICLYGTESTGKSSLSLRLARHFKTVAVEEKAREIIEKTTECTPLHLRQIAVLHANAILEQTSVANRILIVDTDINITASYSRFLFDEELTVEDWVQEANRFDLYLYLDRDAPYIQDGTRLSFSKRNRLDLSHEKQLNSKKIRYVKITGDWEERFEKAIIEIEKLLVC